MEWEPQAAPTESSGKGPLLPAPHSCANRHSATVLWWDAPPRERAVIPLLKTDGLQPFSPQLPLGNPGTAALLPNTDAHCNLVLSPEKPGHCHEPFTPTAPSVHNIWAREQARVGLFLLLYLLLLSSVCTDEQTETQGGHVTSSRPCV